MYRLISHSAPPPPGFFKVWLRAHNGEVQFLSQTCGDCLELSQTRVEDIVREAVAFISTNNLKRVDPATIGDLVDLLNCQRLGNSKTWCYDTDQPNPRTAAVVSGKRGCCGASL